MAREFDFRKEDFRFIASLVHAKTGIVLAEHKEDMVYARIARRLRSLRLGSFRDYCQLLEGDSDGEEIGNFVNAVTTNLTSFYREAHHFDHLRDSVLKPLAQNPPPGKRLRLWSAACSQGSEPYSMALTCLEAIPDIDTWDIKILATDIDTGMLAKASAGVYDADEAEPIPPALRKRYTTASGGKVTMSEAVKQLITFKQMNLIEPWPFKGPMDAVFCRNVVIYFNKDTQKKLFAHMSARMRAGQWLYIGHSETLHSISSQFELCGRTIYRRCA
ncbi:MAG: protein-glutamate O-methyltransferase [Rickettsiales bacterium]|nr:protein-glutamate O-methyltransferase [Rickettsiales bacterium]